MNGLLVLYFALCIGSNVPRFTMPVFAVDTCYNRVSNLILDFTRIEVGVGVSVSVVVEDSTGHRSIVK